MSDSVLPAVYEPGKSYSLDDIRDCPLTSLDMTTIDGRRMAYQALRGGSISDEEMARDGHEFVHILATAQERRVGENGQVRLIPVTALIDADGGVWSTTSEYVLRDLSDMYKCGFKWPWNPPLKIWLVEKPGTTPGHEFFSLSLFPPL